MGHSSSSGRYHEIQRELAEEQRKREAMETKHRQEARARERERAENERRMEEMRHRQREEEARHRRELKELAKTELRNKLSTLEGNIRDINRELAQAATTLTEQQEAFSGACEELATEQEMVREFEHERNDPTIIKCVLLGDTGDGKSTFANRLTGDRSDDGDEGKFYVQASVNSVTQTIQKETCQFVLPSGRTVAISVIDTPGTADSGGRDRHHAACLVEYLRGCETVHRFVFVRQLSNPRFNEHHKKVLRAISNMLGRGFWRYVTIVLTRMDTRRDRRNLPNVQRELREELRREFSLSEEEAPLEMFGIGLEDYEAQIGAFVNGMAEGEVFRCESLHSPLDELEAQVRRLAMEVAQCEAGVYQLRQRKADLNRQVMETEQRLRCM